MRPRTYPSRRSLSLFSAPTFTMHFDEAGTRVPVASNATGNAMAATVFFICMRLYPWVSMSSEGPCGLNDHGGRAGARPPWGVQPASLPFSDWLPAVATTTRLVAVVPMSALLAPLLHCRNVRVELLLLVGVQDGSKRRDLLITLTLHLPANLFHLRPCG